MAWANKSYCAICKSICYTGGYWGDDENSICDERCLLKYTTNQANIIKDKTNIIKDKNSKIKDLEKQLDKKDEKMSELTTILFNIRSCFIFSDDKKRKVK